MHCFSFSPTSRIYRGVSLAFPPASCTDVGAALAPTEVSERLGLLRMKDRSWFCQPSNALAGDGLFEGTSLSAFPRVVLR